MTRTNKVAEVVTVIGYLEIIAGIILGFVFGMQEVEGYYSSSMEMNWVVLFLWSGIGFVSGMLIIAISEIIELLHQLNQRKNAVQEDDLVRIK